MAAALVAMAGGTALVAVLLKTNSEAGRTQAATAAARRAMTAQWPAFTAVYREQTFGPEATAYDPHAVTGHEEVRRIRFRTMDDWETVVLSGRTHGGLDPDGSVTQVHALPGTKDTYRNKIHSSTYPGDAPDRSRSKTLGPNHWLHPWYSDWDWEPDGAVPGAVVRVQHVGKGVCPGSTCSGTVVWLNEHGVPIRYEEWHDGVLQFIATVDEFAAADGPS